MTGACHLFRSPPSPRRPAPDPRPVHRRRAVPAEAGAAAAAVEHAGAACCLRTGATAHFPRPRRRRSLPARHRLARARRLRARQRRDAAGHAGGAGGADDAAAGPTSLRLPPFHRVPPRSARRLPPVAACYRLPLRSGPYPRINRRVSRSSLIRGLNQGKYARKCCRLPVIESLAGGAAGAAIFVAARRCRCARNRPASRSVPLRTVSSGGVPRLGRATRHGRRGPQRPSATRSTVSRQAAVIS
jgi:hypothetical protein